MQLITIPIRLQHLISIFILFIVSTPLTIIAQKRNQFEPDTNRRYFGYHFDDDFLFLSNRDEQYTGGLELEFIGKAKSIQSKKSILNPYPNGIRAVTITLGSSLYTPYNVSDSLIILNDRPFNSTIYAAYGYTAYNKKKTKKIISELYVGIIGSKLPGKVQAAIHTVGESPPAYGWKNRISPKESFILNFRFNQQTNLFTLSGLNFLKLKQLQIASVTEINTGLYLNALSGGLRFSLFNKNNASNSLSTFCFRKKTKRKHATTSYNFYFIPRWQFIIQSTALQGLPWIESPYIITNDVLTRSVWALEGGFNIQFKRMHLSYVIKARSKEFSKYPNNWHNWAGITMGFKF